MGYADHDDHVALGEQTISFELVLGCDHDILLVLRALIQMVETFELADSLQIGLRVLAELV